jgi:hypothetical protein
LPPLDSSPPPPTLVAEIKEVLMDERFVIAKITDRGSLGGGSLTGGPVWVTLDTGERFELDLAPGAHVWDMIFEGEEVHLWTDANGRVTSFASTGPFGRAWIDVPLR